MNGFERQSKFEIRPIIEQKPFESPAAQSFFAKWCEANDGIQPQFVSREEWEKRGKNGILEKTPGGKQTLFIPKDLQLWEMVGVMEAVDKDTFAEKPEKATEAKKKILALGKTFENAGVYIAKRLNSVKDGKEIAEALALEFYQYGQSLIFGGKYKEISQLQIDIEELASHNLSPRETEELDQFLAGDVLYESRKRRIDKLSAGNQADKDKLYEEERRKTLSQFFRVAKKAFKIQNAEENPAEIKSWQFNTPIHKAFLQKVEKAIARQIEVPKQELETSILRRGLDKIIREIKEVTWRKAVNDFFETLGLNLKREEKKLTEGLNISQLKSELEEIRRGGNLGKIVVKEREIANKIQKAVSKFPYQKGASSPSKMVADRHINCVGASIIGGELFREVGLNYLVASVTNHSTIFLITSDGGVEWRDMLNHSFVKPLTDEMIKGVRKDGEPLSVADIVAFSRKPKPEGLFFDINLEKDDGPLYLEQKTRLQHICVFDPENGHRLELLNNIGVYFFNHGMFEEALEANRKIISAAPKFLGSYNNLGMTLYSLGRTQEAIEAYRQAIALNQKHYLIYYNLGNALYSLGRTQEAIEAYRQAIALNQADYQVYRSLGVAFANINHLEYAVQAFEKAIDINPEDIESYQNLYIALINLGRQEEADKVRKKLVNFAENIKDD